MPQPQPLQIRATSATCTTAHGNTWSLPHWARPGIELMFSWMLVGFAKRWVTTGTPKSTFFFFFCLFAISWAAPLAHGGFQSRGWIGAIALAYARARAMRDLSRVWDLHHSSWQCQILNPLSKDWTCNLTVPSRIRQPLCHDGNSKKHILTVLISG